MSQARVPARPRPKAQSPPSSPLLSSSTISFLASWRGQLLICSVVLILGGIYFVLQEPVARLRRKQREARSRARQEELVSLLSAEKESADKLVDESTGGSIGKKERAKERKRDSKKRKGSLRVPTVGTNCDSSAVSTVIESWPAPSIPPTPASTSRSPPKPRAKALPIPEEAKARAQQYTLAPSPLPCSPVPQITELPHLTAPPSVNAESLVSSPTAGPSKSLDSGPSIDGDSVDDGDAGDSSESALSNHNEMHVDSVSNGFSIIPEEGYLPQNATAVAAKKKKRKNRSVPPSPLPVVERRMSRAESEDGPTTPGRKMADSPSIPITPSRRARKASLNRPLNVELDELLTERERTIESLRAEVGVAKAEEAKARDEAVRLRVAQERLRGDVERSRKLLHKAENEGRRREAEYNTRFAQLSSEYTSVLHRLGSLETMIRESGASIPPSSPLPATPANGHAQLLVQHLQPMPSPISPGSPFGLGFMLSPHVAGGGQFISYPSPGLYPSPMLHPNYSAHSSHSPSPFRRQSTGGADAGEEQATPQRQNSGSFPFDMGVMPSPSSHRETNGHSGPPTAADIRRMSIESSVLKKKVKEEPAGSDSGDFSKEAEQSHLPGIEEAAANSENESAEGREEVLEDAEVLAEPSHETTSDSRRSSPSLSNRASVILTPASSNVFHQTLIRGADTPDFGSSTEALHVELANGKAVVNRDEVFFRRHDSMGSSDQGSTSSLADNHGQVSTVGGDSGSDHAVDEIAIQVGSETAVVQASLSDGAEYMPIFGSLAHTPQQLAEIQRMREATLKAREQGQTVRSGRSQSDPSRPE